MPDEPLRPESPPASRPPDLLDGLLLVLLCTLLVGVLGGLAPLFFADSPAIRNNIHGAIAGAVLGAVIGAAVYIVFSRKAGRLRV